MSEQSPNPAKGKKGKYPCTIAGCQKSYISSQSLSKHKHQKHYDQVQQMKQLKPKMNMCDKCNNFYSSSESKRKHKCKNAKPESILSSIYGNSSESFSKGNQCHNYSRGFNSLAPGDENYNTCEPFELNQPVDFVSSMLKENCSSMMIQPQKPPQLQDAHPVQVPAFIISVKEMETPVITEQNFAKVQEFYQIRKTLNSVAVQVNPSNFDLATQTESKDVKALNDVSFNSDTIVNPTEATIQEEIKVQTIYDCWNDPDRLEKQEYIDKKMRHQWQKAEKDGLRTPKFKGVRAVRLDEAVPATRYTASEEDKKQMQGFYEQYQVKVQEFISKNQEVNYSNLRTPKSKSVTRSQKKQDLMMVEANQMFLLPQPIFDPLEVAKLINILLGEDNDPDILLCEIDSYFSQATFFCNLVQQTSTFTFINSKPIHSFLHDLVNEFMGQAMLSNNPWLGAYLSRIDIIHKTTKIIELRDSNNSFATHFCCFKIEIDSSKAKELIQAINRSAPLKYVLWVLPPDQCLGRGGIHYFQLLSDHPVEIINQDEQQIKFYLYYKDSSSDFVDSNFTTPGSQLGKRHSEVQMTPKLLGLELEVENQEPQQQLSPRSKRLLENATKEFTPTLAYAIINKQVNQQKVRDQLHNSINANEPLEQFEKLLSLTNKLQYLFTIKQTIPLAELIKNMIGSDKHVGKFVSEAQIIEGLKKLQEASGGWIQIIESKSKQAGFIKQVQKINIEQIKTSLKLHCKYEPKGTEQRLSIQKDRLFYNQVDKLRAYWNLSRFEGENLEKIQNVLNKVVALPRSQKVTGLRVGQEQLEQLQSSIANDAVYKTLNQKEKAEFIEGSKFYIHYQTLNQQMLRGIYGRLDLLLKSYKESQNLRATVEDMENDIFAMVKREADKHNLLLGKRIGKSYLTRSFECYRKTNSNQVINESSGPCEMIIKIFWKALIPAQASAIAIMDTNFNKQGRNIVSILETHNLLGKPAYLMPKYPYNLRTLLEGFFINQKCFKYVAFMIIKTLFQAHKNKVYHLNIKPENILFDKYHVPYLTDWLNRNVQRDGIINEYSPPEFINREIQPLNHLMMKALDSWGLGLLLFYILCGSLPYTVDDMLALKDKNATLTNRPFEILNPKLDGQWFVIIRNLLTPDPLYRSSIQSLYMDPFFKHQRDQVEIDTLTLHDYESGDESNS